MTTATLEHREARRAERAIQNYEDGNLSDACEIAGRAPFWLLQLVAREVFGKNSRAAWAVACFLKGLMSFQNCCEIEARDQDREWTGGDCIEEAP